MDPVASVRQPPPGAPFFIVINAGSGKEDGVDAHAVIARVLDGAGRRFRLLVVDDPARLSEVVSEAVRRAETENGIVVAAGGDGTLNAVAAQVLGTGLPYAVLPQGTFNLFGREYGVPQDLELATTALLRATVEPVQVGRVNGVPFLVNASLGLYPRVIEQREEAQAEHGRGRMVAYWSGLRTLLGDYEQLDLRIEVQGRTREVRTPTLFVGNNRLQLRRIGVGDALPEHGRLAAIVVRPTGGLAMLRLALRGALGRLGAAENIESFAFRTLTVTPRGRRRIKVAVDGEVVTLDAPLVFDVAPEPLRLLRPAPEDRADDA